MSTKIKLWFEELPNPLLEEKLPDIGAFIRLFCSVKFRSKSGWQDSCDAILDTGAPLSVIPLDIWEEAEPEILTEHEIQGINPKKECAIPALVGKIKCILIDDEANQSKELEIISYLASTNTVPLIIGFRNILEVFTIHFDYEADEAYIELKE